MLTRHAPLWARLRDWLAEALHNHAGSLEYRTRKQLQPIRLWLTLIEHLLRRLVLLAATTLPLDRPSRWRPPPRAQADAPRVPATPLRSNASRATLAFRLYGIYWGAAAPHGTHAAPQAATRPRLIVRLTLSPDALLRIGDRPARPTATHRPSTTRRAYISRKLPDLTVDQFQAWLAAQPEITCSDIDLQLLREQASTRRLKIDGQPNAPHKMQSPHPDASELISTQPFMDRLALLSQLIGDPDALIRRAALAFARHREIALRLAAAAAPAKPGLLRTSPHIYGTVIPLHTELTTGMEWFAVSYTEPDSS